TRSPEGIRSWLVRQPPDGHDPPGYTAKRLDELALCPLPVGVIARFDRREQMGCHASLSTQLREKADISCQRTAGHGAARRQVGPRPNPAVRLQSAFDLGRVCAN